MYRCQVVNTVDDMQDRIDAALEIINNEHGNIISTSTNKYHVYIFYEIPEVA